MRPNNRQRSRGGRSGGGGGGGGNTHHHKPQHHGSNRAPNRNQIFDSSGPDVRVRGNAHQVFDKYQSLAREAASSGDRILAEAYFQYADHYYRVIQSMGGFVPRNNWGEGGEDGQQQGQPGQQSGQPQQGQGGPQSGESGDLQSGDRGEQGPSEQEHRSSEHRPSEHRPSEHRSSDNRQGDNRQGENRQAENRQGDNRRQSDRRQNDYRENGRDRDRDNGEAEPGLNGVAFLQNGRTAPGGNDPAVEEQPEVPEFVPASNSRRA